MATFGQTVKEARLKNKLTMRELSKLTGLSIGYICDIEKGRKIPKNAHTIFSIDLKLNTSVDLTDLAITERLKNKAYKAMFDLLEYSFKRQASDNNYPFDGLKEIAESRSTYHLEKILEDIGD
ncbi:MAG: helix-turn-helix transcriptional regulator [Desulfobacteraceae bacterium]|nr:helix-turn-helix transcriptional regulator [Desulfobacteraceae bacterium]